MVNMVKNVVKILPNIKKIKNWILVKLVKKISKKIVKVVKNMVKNGKNCSKL